MNTQVRYIARGLVYGYLWGGGEGSYQSKTIRTATRKEMLNEIEEGLKDGSLDGGMGFESLAGACMTVTEITTIEIDGKDFTHEESEDVYFGKLNERQVEHLQEHMEYET